MINGQGSLEIIWRLQGSLLALTVVDLKLGYLESCLHSQWLACMTLDMSMASSGLPSITQKEMHSQDCSQDCHERAPCSARHAPNASSYCYYRWSISSPNAWVSVPGLPLNHLGDLRQTI